MRILFLTHYFPPEVNAPASRTFEHGREWVKAGHQVTVVTCAPNHPSGRLYPGYRNRLWRSEELGGIRVIRLWTYLAANEGFVRRTLNYVSYLLAAVLATPFLPRADVVVSTSPQFFCGLAGYAVSRLKRAPWVLEIRDLWPETILAVGAIRNRRLIRLLEGVEGWAYRKADRVVALTDAFRRHIEARGAEPARIRVIKNGVDLTRFHSPTKDPALLRELGLAGKFVAAYFGTHGMAHRLETVLEAARLLKDDPRIVFLLVGDGAERARLVELRERMGLANVIMLGQQPKERMPALWGACDVSLVLLRKTPLFETVIPSKIFEAMAMERPIVLGVGGECRRLIEEAGCGQAIEPENAAELAEAVRRFADHPDLARRMGQRGRQVVAEVYDRTKLAAAFAEMMLDLVSPPRDQPRSVLKAGRGSS
jgi:glycosyltransferase involved in cell wall biosynthesis